MVVAMVVVVIVILVVVAEIVVCGVDSVLEGCPRSLPWPLEVSELKQQVLVVELVSIHGCVADCVRAETHLGKALAAYAA